MEVATAKLLFTAASTAFSVIGAIQSANAESNAAKYNAAVAKQNAKIAQQQSATDIDRQRRIAYKTQGAMTAGYAASGVTMEGTPLDIMEQSAAEAKLDELNIKYNADLESLGYQSEARLNKMRASSARTGGFLSAGASLLSGGLKTANAYSAYKGTA